SRRRPCRGLEAGAAMKRTAVPILAALALFVAGCDGSGSHRARTIGSPKPAKPHAKRHRGHVRHRAYKVPPLLSKSNVYAADAANRLSPVVRHFRPLIYVPNS